MTHIYKTRAWYLEPFPIGIRSLFFFVNIISDPQPIPQLGLGAMVQCLGNGHGWLWHSFPSHIRK